MNSCDVILVDDDVPLVDSYSDILTLNGISVVAVCHDGKSAVDLFKKHRPCVTILDMQMPKYDGSYAIKHIKELDHNAKIIVLTAYPEIEPDLEDISAVVQKPTNTDDFIEVIKCVCTSPKT
ncbi:response regulator [Nitrosopumilus sp.]|uniref:response regulator n=1 Tax=Nitrosopumilus sp. TaxID=2024843 RepID=UPI003D12EBF4